MTTDYEDAIDRQYGRPGLGERILEAVREAGSDVGSLTRDDLAGVAEFHLLGRAGTRQLAALGRLGRDDRILDVGSGIGGPARTFADEFGCRVVGVDVTEEYVLAARLLTDRVGLADRVAFCQGNALALPVGDGSFDAATLVHVTMNVPDKPRLFGEVSRALRPGGRLALFEVLQGDGGPSHFPAPWADGPDVSFLATPDELRNGLEAADLREREWVDRTAECRRWFREFTARIAERPADAPSPPGFDLLMGPTSPQKAQNQLRNLEEGRIRVVQAVYAAPE